MPWLALPLTIQGLEQLMKIHTGYPASKYVCVFLLVDLSDELGISSLKTHRDRERKERVSLLGVACQNNPLHIVEAASLGGLWHLLT